MRRETSVNKIGKEAMRFVVNDIPTRCVNLTYDLYSKVYKGQLRLGLPVSKKLIATREEIRSRAAGKLALTLYHMFFHATGSRYPRNEIKLVLLDELDKERVKLTEDVILLTQKELRYLIEKRFHIPRRFTASILMEADRRRILKESLKKDRLPAYFESQIEEREQNGRGDYEIVYYRDFTEEGKEIAFRRLASMEEVTSGDNRPSVVLVPGIANNSNCYNLNNHYSIAKDMADMGFWVYLFDPRGMGINEGKFDPFYTVDTLIDYDLPTVVRFIYARSKGKPVILVGHSMGGIVSENMILNSSLRCNLNTLDHLDATQKAYLDKILPPLEEARRYVKMIRGVVTFGSPKFFLKMTHILFPSVLWLNHVSRMFRLRYVPFEESIWFLTTVPGVREVTRTIMNSNLGGLNPLISPKNHKKDKRFVERFFQNAGESIPLGLGFQFLKAIYNGEGFKRMDPSRLNYSSYLSYFPDQIPVFHFWGTEDALSPPANLRYSQYYPHKIKKVYRLEKVKDLTKVEIVPERSQLIDFVIEGANHVDLLYGKAAEEIIHPLLMKIIQQTWGGWSYPEKPGAPIEDTTA